jgi:hypothetical protein
MTFPIKTCSSQLILSIFFSLGGFSQSEKRKMLKKALGAE